MCRLRPHKAPALEALRKKTQPITAPPQDLHPSLAPKDKQLPREGILGELQLHKRCESIKALATLSPLLADLYMRRFVLGWQRKDFEARFKARVVTYADDLVIGCKGSAAQALEAMRSLMKQIRLTVNEEKTRVCRVPDETFDFLGYTFGRCYSRKTGRAYLGTRPSRKSIRRVIERLHVETALRTGALDTALIVQRINRILRGWAEYFCLGPVSKSYHALDRYTLRRLRRWLCDKRKVGSHGYKRFPDGYFYARLGLVSLRLRTRPWATA